MPHQEARKGLTPSDIPTPPGSPEVTPVSSQPFWDRREGLGGEGEDGRLSQGLGGVWGPFRRAMRG